MTCHLRLFDLQDRKRESQGEREMCGDAVTSKEENKRQSEKVKERNRWEVRGGGSM